MAFKSTAQRAKFASLVKEGKMSQETFDKWMSETPKGAKLPKRAPARSKGLVRSPRRTAK